MSNNLNYLFEKYLYFEGISKIICLFLWLIFLIVYLIYYLIRNIQILYNNILKKINKY